MEYLFGLTCFIILIIGLFSYIFITLFKTGELKQNADEHREKKSKGQNKAQQSKQLSKVSRKPVKVSSKRAFTHPDLQCSFKGHTDDITSAAVSYNGKGLVTASEDRTLFFYNTRSAFSGTGTSSLGTRTNIHLDHVVKLCWSPDYTAVVIQKADTLKLEVMKGTKKSDGTLTALTTVREFPEPFTEKLLTLRVANNGKFIMTCDVKSQLCLWDLKGELLTSFDTRHGDTISATLSYDDKFIVTTGFTPDAKVFEVQYDKEGNFKEVKRVFQLTGHNSKIFSCDVSLDSSKMITVSKDGTWRLYNTDVRYKQKEDPKLLVEGEVASAKDITDLSKPCLVRLAPDCRVVLVSVMSSVHCYSAKTGHLIKTIENIYPDYIMELFFDGASQYFITIGGRCGHLFHNVAGYLETIQDFEVALKEASYAGLKERIRLQIEATRASLEKIENRQTNSDKDDKKKN